MIHCILVGLLQFKLMTTGLRMCVSQSAVWSEVSRLFFGEAIIVMVTSFRLVKDVIHIMHGFTERNSNTLNYIRKISNEMQMRLGIIIFALSHV